MKKMCVSPRSPHLFFGKLFYWRAMSLSLVRLDSGRRKLSRWTPWSSCQMFKKLCLPLICTQEKKSQIPNGISKYFIHWSIYELFYNSPRKKKNWNNRAYRSNKFKFFNKKFVCSFFPLNLRGGQCFVTAEDRHLWNVSETLKEFTLPVIFFSLSQDIVNPV